jgi:dTDP-4-amino-4,6-dideoxygalactose transaminase
VRVYFYDVDRETGLMVQPDIIVGTLDVYAPVSLGGQLPEVAVDEGYIPKGNVVADVCHGPYELPDWAVAACFSFHPCKHIAAGEGGAVVTNDGTIAERCRLLRSHGRASILWDNSRQVMDALGYNYRMPELSAALALSQLRRLDENIQRRREIAAIYDEEFNGRVRTVPHSDASARHLYQLLVEDRDGVRQHLAALGVGSQTHYTPVVPLQPYWRERFQYREGMFPNAEYHAAHTLSIPLFPSMTDEDVERVVGAVREVATEAPREA